MATTPVPTSPPARAAAERRPAILAVDDEPAVLAAVATKDVGLGTGLGLTSALQIVTERHGGSLTVDSEPGRTTFTARLPLEHP